MIVRMCRPLVLAAANIINPVAVSVYTGLTSVCPPGPGWFLCALRAVDVHMEHVHQQCVRITFILEDLFCLSFDSTLFRGSFLIKNATFRQRRVRGGPLRLLVGTGSGSITLLFLSVSLQPSWFVCVRGCLTPSGGCVQAEQTCVHTYSSTTRHFSAFKEGLATSRLLL